MAKKKARAVREVDEKKVQAALEEAGYEFPKFKNRKEREAFVEDHGYDPEIALNSTIAMAKVFKNWKARIQPLAPEE